MHPLTPQCLPVDNNITSDYANVARLLTPHCLKFCLNYSKVSQTLGCLLAITQHQCCVTANGQDLGLLRTSGYFSIWGRSRLSAWSASISPIPRKKYKHGQRRGRKKGQSLHILWLCKGYLFLGREEERESVFNDSILWLQNGWSFLALAGMQVCGGCKHSLHGSP